MTRLAHLLARFGGAIEADLAGKADVGELWRARRWRLLLNLIDHLPPWSHYGAAVADDEDYASAALAREAKPQPPSVAEWTPLVDAVNALVDRVGDLISATAAGRGGRIQIPRRDRPVTAIDRVREQRSEQQRLSLVKRLLPGD